MQFSGLSILETQIVTCMLDSTNNDTKHLMKLLTKFNLVQLIKSPTRTTATTKTLIDHIITNRSESVSKSGVLSCGISDHDAVFMTKSMRLPKLKAHQDF